MKADHMSTTQDSPQSTPARQALMRLVIYSSCGVASGIVAAVASIMIEFLIWGIYAFSVGVLAEHVEHWSPLRKHFWDVARTNFEERYLGGLVAGFIFGALTAGLSKPSRCVASVTTVWAAGLGSVGTVLVTILSVRVNPAIVIVAGNADPASIVAWSVEFAATGATFGFTLALLVRFAEKTAAKWMQKPSRLASELANLDPAFEKGLADGIPDGAD
jgi:hypothetical protein